MCGRYTLRTPAVRLTQLFDLAGDVPVLKPRFNIAPTQAAPVIRMNGRRRLVMCRWGLIPSWADDQAVGARLLNARSESVALKPAFRAAFKQRRCLVPADGFYEWQKVGSKKQPFYFLPLNDWPFAFAGLWESWHKDDLAIESFTILTTEANEMVRPLHERMPVILAPEDFALWLDPQMHDAQKLQPLLRPYPADGMSSYPVSTMVNGARNEDPRCIERLVL